MVKELFDFKRSAGQHTSTFLMFRLLLLHYQDIPQILMLLNVCSFCVPVSASNSRESQLSLITKLVLNSLNDMHFRVRDSTYFNLVYSRYM